MSRSKRNAAIVLSIVAVLAVGWLLLRPGAAEVEVTGDAESPQPASLSPKKRASSAGPPESPLPLPNRARPGFAATVTEAPDATFGVLSGRVLNWGNGKAVADAELSFESERGIETVATNAAGEFQFEPSDLDPRRLAVISAHSFVPYAPDLGDSPIEFRPRAGQAITGITVYLTPLIEYTGTVLDKGGEPASGATISISSGGDRQLMPIENTFTSDDKGVFVFFAPDFAVLEATHPTLGAGRAVVDGAVQITRKLTLHLSTDAPAPPATARGNHREEAPSPKGSASIRGEVVRQDSGKPVPAFTVAVQRKTGGLRRVTVKHIAVMSADGEFVVDGLAEGSYEVVVMAYGLARSQPVAAEARTGQARTVRVVLDPGATIVGRVIDAETTRPLNFAKLIVEGSPGGGTSALPMVAVAVTAEDGSFELSGVPAGRHSLNIVAADHDSQIIGGLELTSGARVELPTIELNPIMDGEEPRLELVGIGAQLGADEDGLMVIKVFENGGAAAAGLRAGETLTAIDGKSIVELGMNGSIQLIRGPVGSTVTLTITGLDGESRDVDVTRVKLRV